ncbi:MAG: hypothetical protein KGY65_08770 [Candidatus Thermoplasmatota archaeon]|nr:hypothetical protein [Candidatus Thermoplasmatota archaeon]
MTNSTVLKLLSVSCMILFVFTGFNPLYQAETSTTESYPLVVIAADEFIDELQPLKTHKENMGMPTKLVSLSTVYDEMYWNGRDNPEKIKYFIKESIETWQTAFVLLVGDFRKMPIRYVYNNEPSDYYEPRYISELYYADIYDEHGDFSDWNSNNNEYFGEWKGSQAQDQDIDLYPDVAVGRLACRNSFEVKIMVDKIIHYETQTYGKEWFNKFVVVAGDTYPPGQYPFDTSPYEGEENTLAALENMTGFNPVKLWVSTGAFTGPKDVIRTINQGCGFMFFEGHASPVAWGTHPPEIEKNGTWVWGLKNYHMNFLMNRYKLPIVVAAACHNGQFDVTPLNLLDKLRGEVVHVGEWARECWAWKLTSQPFGGSIATISNTGLGMSKEDKDSMEGAGDFMDMQFFVEYGNNRQDYVGEVWMDSISNYIDEFPVDWTDPAGSDSSYDAKTPQEWTLFGDPSLKIGGYQ